MQKIQVTSDELQIGIIEAKIPIPDKKWFQARPSEGQYPNADTLSPLVMPGGDIGDMAIILAASNTYGFELERDKLREIFEPAGKKDDHVTILPANAYLDVLIKNPKAYELTKEDIDLLSSFQTQEKDIYTDYLNGAVVLIKGDYSVLPQITIQSEIQTKHIVPFVFHYSLVNKRHRNIAKSLVEKELVKLFASQDEEYVYEVISDMTDNHLFESISRFVPTLPIYLLTFNEDGTFSIEDRGRD